MASPFRVRTISMGVCLFLLAISGSNAQRQPKVTGFFTNMHYIPEAGDVIGLEVWIVYAREHFFATVQDAEGEPDPPVVAPVDVFGSQVKFVTGDPAPDTITHYQGTVSKAGLMLSVDGTPASLLKRQNSFWQ